MMKYTIVCIHSTLSSCCTSASVAPISVIRTNPLMPNVDGKSQEKPFQKIGILLEGQEMPLAKSKGIEMNTNMMMNDSLSCAIDDSAMLKNTHDVMNGTMNASSVCQCQIWTRSNR